MRHSHYHGHSNEGHSHEHDPRTPHHHGAPFGRRVVEVEPTSEAIASVLLDEPPIKVFQIESDGKVTEHEDFTLMRQLKESIAWAEARKRDKDDGHD